MRKTLFATLLGTVSALSTPAFSDPAIITTDIATGVILSSNNIDIKQDPYIIGKIALLFIALNDVMTGDVDPEMSVDLPGYGEKSFADILSMTMGEFQQSAVATTFAAATIAQSPNILNERMGALFREVGMRGTSIKTTRTRSGEPVWSGFTTSRDIARITTALVLTHGKYAKSLLPRDPQSERDDSWFYRDGMCLMISQAPDTGRSFVSVIHGASTEENCHKAAFVSVQHNDDRINSVAPKQGK